MTDYNETWLKFAPAISAIASSVAAIAAATNVIVQNRNARRNRSVDLLLKKETEFDSERMCKIRIRAAKSLLGQKNDPQAVARILDFMESVSVLVLEGNLEKTHVWEIFYHFFSHYYYAAKNLIEPEQKKDPSIWASLVKLHKIMESIQTKHGSPFPNNLPANITDFLNEELILNEN